MTIGGRPMTGVAIPLEESEVLGEYAKHAKPVHVVVLPEPLNEGEDLNYAQFMVIGHTDRTVLEPAAIRSLVRRFFAEVEVDWEDEDKAQKFLDYAMAEGYIVFPPATLEWCVE